jgi:small subunit ribosomal protein S16
MAVKIRLRQQGRTNRPFYRVVLTDSRNPRDGRYVETLGWYNPLEADNDKSMSLKQDRIQYWLDQGAIMSERVEALVARGSPSLFKAKKEKEVAKREKHKAKRKARKKAKATA